MEVQSFTTLKLQAVFPTVRLSFFDKAVFTPHFVQPTYIANIKKNLLKTLFVSFLTWMKSIYYASYHLYRIFRWSTPQILALGHVTTAQIFRQAVKFGKKLVMTYQVRHRNVNTAARIAILCLSLCLLAYWKAILSLKQVR